MLDKIEVNSLRLGGLHLVYHQIMKIKKKLYEHGLSINNLILM